MPESKRGRRVLMLLQNCAYPRDDRVRREARSLAAAGYRVTVVAPSSRLYPRREIIDGVRVFRFATPQAGKGFLGYVREYALSLTRAFMVSLRVFLGEGFDVVHAHQPPDAFALIAAFYKLFGKRYVLDHHDLAPELYKARFRGDGNPLVHRMLLWQERLACALADKVIATNESYRREEMGRGGVPASRIAVVRNGPDLAELRRMEPNPAVRGLAPFIVGYVGVMGVQDGVENLVVAVRHLAFDLGRDGFRCVVVGSGQAMSDLEALTRKLGLEPYIVFAGWLDRPADVARHLGAMDICVAPEPSDPYNDRSTAAKVMEYMAMGKPVVSFDLPEHRRSAGDAALYARPNDPGDLAAKIAALMDDPGLRAELGRRGRARIENELSWQCQAIVFLKLYEEMALR